MKHAAHNLRILHITNWFPARDQKLTALWVQKHIDSLPSHISSKVIHIEFQKGPLTRTRIGRELHGNYAVRIFFPIVPWKLVELGHLVILYWLLVIRQRTREFDLINFHIAYPQLIYWRWLARKIDKPIAVTEHWSAYHYHFHLPAESTALIPIRRIFEHHIPVITVSKALAQDIRAFCGYEFPSFVVPNVVDTKVFRYERKEVLPVFFMVSLWKEPKDPFTVLRSFADFVQSMDTFRLRIGGYGPLDTPMRELAESLGIENIDWLGPLDSGTIAQEFNQATAFIHLSGYETFSVVCAESISCGCPVIASRVGGIPEFIDERNGFLLDNNDDLSDAMSQLCEKKFERKAISQEAIRRFSSGAVGQVYGDTVTQIVNDYRAVAKE